MNTRVHPLARTIIACSAVSFSIAARAGAQPVATGVQGHHGANRTTPVRHGGEVRIVAPSGGDFTSIQAAVNASAPGDTVLVKHGSYNPGFTIDGKGINVVEETGATAWVFYVVTIRNIPAGQVACISGLQQQTVNVSNNVGAVRIDGLSGFNNTFGLQCAVTNSADVSISRTTLSGGEGFAPFADGDTALTIHSSAVTLYDTNWTGGRGGDGNPFDKDGNFDATHGGDALIQSGVSTFLFAAGSHFAGGAGGNADCLSGGSPGNGGDGMRVNAGTSIGLASTTTGGAAGTACAAGVAGQAGGFTSTLPGAARDMQLATPVRDKSVVPIAFVGQPGDVVSLFISRGTTRVYEPDLRGVRMVEGPYSAILYMGVVPPGGLLEQTLRLDDAWTPQYTATLYSAQALFAQPGGDVVLSNPVPLVVLDSVY